MRSDRGYATGGGREHNSQEYKDTPRQMEKDISNLKQGGAEGESKQDNAGAGHVMVSSVQAFAGVVVIANLIFNPGLA